MHDIDISMVIWFCRRCLLSSCAIAPSAVTVLTACSSSAAREICALVGWQRAALPFLRSMRTLSSLRRRATRLRSLPRESQTASSFVFRGLIRRALLVDDSGAGSRQNRRHRIVNHHTIFATMEKVRPARGKGGLQSRARGHFTVLRAAIAVAITINSTIRCPSYLNQSGVNRV